MLRRDPNDKLHIAADQERREIVLVRLGRLALADDATAPDDCDPVGDLQHLVQLVADEDDAVSFVGQPAEHAEDFLRLLGGKHGGGLVEHEDPCLAVERLEDLYPLLPPDRKAADSLLRIDLEAESRERSRMRRLESPGR